MSIFALISSSISIYYQQLISKINQQKIEIKTNKNLTNSIIFSVNKYEDLFNTILAAFRYDRNFADLIADNTLYENSPSRSRERFFINVKNNDFLNHSGKNMQGWGYAVFGRVIKGDEVLDKIRGVATGNLAGHQDVPTETVTIESVAVVEA